VGDLPTRLCCTKRPRTEDPLFPVRCRPAGRVTGTPGAVERPRTAMRAWSPAVRRSRSRAMSFRPGSVVQVVRARLRRWRPLRRRRTLRPARPMARRAPSRPGAPGPSFLRGLASRPGGTTAPASRPGRRSPGRAAARPASCDDDAGAPKSAAVRSGPADLDRLAAKPVVCRSGRPDGIVAARQARMAAPPRTGRAPGPPDGAASSADRFRARRRAGAGSHMPPGHAAEPPTRNPGRPGATTPVETGSGTSRSDGPARRHSPNVPNDSSQPLSCVPRAADRASAGTKGRVVLQTTGPPKDDCVTDNGSHSYSVTCSLIADDRQVRDRP
jgi:hypothetical protein